MTNMYNCMQRGQDSNKNELDCTNSSIMSLEGW